MAKVQPIVKHKTKTNAPPDPLALVDGVTWDNDPHIVTGLEALDATADVDKPVSTAQAAAIALLAARLEVDVTDPQFGAVGDGTTDNTIAIAAAATFANANRMALRFRAQPGSYATFPIQFGGTAPASGTFTGSITGTTLTVETPPTIPIYAGQGMSGTSVTSNSIVLQQLTGPVGGMGTYQLDHSSTATSTTITASATSFIGSIAGTVLTVSSMLGGSLLPGQSLSKAIPGTVILSGTFPTYTVNKSQALASCTMQASPITVVPLPFNITGDNQTSTVVSGLLTGATYGRPLLTVVADEQTTQVNQGFQIGGFTIDAANHYKHCLLLHGFNYATAHDMVLTRANDYGFACLGDTAQSCIYAHFRNLTSRVNGGGGFYWNGSDGSGDHNIQAVDAIGLFSQGNLGPGWSFDYADFIGVDCESESNSGPAVLIDHCHYLELPGFYTEANGGPITGTANSFGVSISGTSTDGVNSILLTAPTADINYWNGTARIRNAGAIVPTTVNGNTFTTGTYTLTGGAGKTFTFSNTLTLTGGDGTAHALPSTSSTLARTDAAQTFTGTQTFSATIAGNINGNATTVATNANLTGPVTSSGNATTVGANQISRANLAQGVARSIIGVTGNATANVADIQGTANQVLVVNSAGTALLFGQVSLTAGVIGVLPVANGGTGDAGTAWTSYTPVVTSSVGAFTTVSATGRYKQIGKTVWWQAYVTVTTAGTATGQLRATLPFTAAAFAYAGVSRENLVSGKSGAVDIEPSATFGIAVASDTTSYIANGAGVIFGATYEVP